MSGILFFAPPIRLPFLKSAPLPPELPVSAAYANIWDVLTDGGMSVFDVDSTISMESSHANKVANFPIENGGFGSYDKVNEPKTIKLKMTVGSANGRSEKFLNALETELVATNLRTIVSPEISYSNMTLDKYSYQRTAEKTVDQVSVELSFIEIVQVQFQTTQAKLIPAPKHAAATPAPLPKNVAGASAAGGENTSGGRS